MKYSRLHNHVGKACALLAACLILPALAYAGTDNGKGNNDRNNGNQYGRGNAAPNPRPVPEANTGIVLVPFIGAVLLFSARQLFRAKATQKNGC
jgi:hypothetical protein